ncbi:MAG: helix-turn-helix transcriptional regulator [Lawsonibacter sp.]|nr:helix-turn-helix transcriptional regulator [Lawsonibacter sp.]
MKLSQSALAERAGLTRNCIQQMECHEHLPLPSTMFNLIQALDFSEEETVCFWRDLSEAYRQDNALQQENAEPTGVV